jgi:hypothetical protein
VDCRALAGSHPPIEVVIGDLGDPAGSTSLSGPDVATLLASLTLADILPSFSMGFDALFSELANVLESAVFGKALPIVGTGMGTRFDVFGQIQEKVGDNLDELTEFNAALIEQC